MMTYMRESMKTERERVVVVVEMFVCPYVLFCKKNLSCVISYGREHRQLGPRKSRRAIRQCRVELIKRTTSNL